MKGLITRIIYPCVLPAHPISDNRDYFSFSSLNGQSHELYIYSQHCSAHWKKEKLKIRAGYHVVRYFVLFLFEKEQI
jgi:hypothetical protein